MGLYLRNGNEYPGGHGRRLPRAGGAVQRQLPLRRRGTAVPARRRQGPRWSTRPSSPASCSPSATRLPELEVLIQVADDSGATNSRPMRWTSNPSPPPPNPRAGACPTPSGDDLYILYTGGNDRHAQGVLWRQHDIFMLAGHGRLAVHGRRRTVELLRRSGRAGPGLRAASVRCC